MERSPVITLLFKFRITILLSLLAICDIFAIFYAYERTMAKGKFFIKFNLPRFLVFLETLRKLFRVDFLGFIAASFTV